MPLDRADKRQATHLAGIVHAVADEIAWRGVPRPGVEAFDGGVGLAGEDAGEHFLCALLDEVRAGESDGLAAVENIVDQQDAAAFNWPRYVGVHLHAARAFARIRIALQPDRVESQVDAVARESADQICSEGRCAQQNDNTGPFAL